MALPDTSVVYFDSTMSGAPTLSNTAGLAIAVLDACLQDGFGSVTLTTPKLEVASNVCTATCSGGHGFTMYGSTTTGPVITIAGVSGDYAAAFNTRHRITSVPSSTTFTFVTGESHSGIPDGTYGASDTVTAKRSPAGFTKDAGTNIASYRSDDVTGNRLYLRVDDTQANYCRLRGYSSITSLASDTGNDPFPTDTQLSGGAYLYKANSTSRAWTLVSDGKMIYFHCDASGGAGWAGGFAFGDLASYKASDPYGVCLTASITSTGTHCLYSVDNTSGSWLCRAYTGVGSATTSARYSHGKVTGLGYSGEVFPALADNGLHLWPVEAWDSNTSSRGLLAGLWCPVHANTNLTHGTFYSNCSQLPGCAFVLQKITSSGYFAAHDLTGPWR